METTREVKAVFSVSGWDEQPYAEADGVKLAKARYTKRYRGDLEGTSVTESLMVYRTDGSATFVELERFEGSVLGKSGSFVIHSDGEYRAGFADSRGHIVPGTGTGELRTLTGETPYRVGHAPEHPVVFRLAFG
ncbi:DUF3224 domain-containing protein [Archangium minus]|uniref:DUF3224 domain-containing protein n=1 Tax=Archangium minus TaxID=83450 RepID=A0ABY9WJ95_9BACT|nr:DUF3224 domain-containing protein [Archangium minus]